MLKLKARFSQVFSVSNLYLPHIRSFIKLVLVGLQIQNEAYNLYNDMMGLNKYQTRATSDSLCQNGSHICNFY